MSIAVFFSVFCYVLYVLYTINTSLFQVEFDSYSSPKYQSGVTKAGGVKIKSSWSTGKNLGVKQKSSTIPDSRVDSRKYGRLISSVQTGSG